MLHFSSHLPAILVCLQAPWLEEEERHEGLFLFLSNSNKKCHRFGASQIVWMTLFKLHFFCSQLSCGFGGVKCKTETQGMKDMCPVTTSQAVKHGAEHTIACVSISKPLLRNQSLLVFCFVPSGLAISEGFTEEVAELWLWETYAHSGWACLKIFNF